MTRPSLRAALLAAALFPASWGGLQARAQEAAAPVASTQAAAGFQNAGSDWANLSATPSASYGKTLADVLPPGLSESPASFNPDGSAALPQLSVPVADAERASEASPKIDALAAPLSNSNTPSSLNDKDIVPQPAAAAKPAQKPHKMFEDRAYLVSSIAFHVAGAFDLASTIYGISHIPWESESNPVFLKLFGEKNARNIPLIAGGWLVTHASVQLLVRFLFRRAKKEAKEGHKVKRILLDALALGILGVGVFWHADAAATWYGPGRL